MDNHRSLWPDWREEKLYAALLSGILFIVFLGGVVKVLAGLESLAVIGKAPTTPYTVTVTGEGKVTGVPDIATVDLGVLTMSKKVADAQAENTRKVNGLTGRLKALGIAERDLKTTQYTIYPRYDYQDGRSTLSGYDVQQTLTVKVRDLGKLNAVLQAAGEVEANQVGGLNFTVDEPEALKQEARRKAIVNARDKARDLARAVGVTLGPVVSFNEISSDQPPYPYFAREALGAGGGAPAPDVQRGSIEVVSNVTLTYEIR